MVHKTSLFKLNMKYYHHSIYLASFFPGLQYETVYLRENPYVQRFRETLFLSTVLSLSHFLGVTFSFGLHLLV